MSNWAWFDNPRDESFTGTGGDLMLHDGERQVTFEFDTDTSGFCVEVRIGEDMKIVRVRHDALTAKVLSEASRWLEGKG